MWIQTMAVQSSLAVGKTGQESQGKSTPNSPGVDFAAWLQASLDSVDASVSGMSSTSGENLVGSELPATADENLLNMLQEWIAAALQPLLLQEVEQPVSAEEPAKHVIRPDGDVQSFSKEPAEMAGGLNIGQISNSPDETFEPLWQLFRLGNASTGNPLQQAILTLLRRLETESQTMGTENVQINVNRIQSDVELGQRLLAVLQKIQATDADALSLDIDELVLNNLLLRETYGSNSSNNDGLQKALHREFNRLLNRVIVTHDGNDGSTQQDGSKLTNTTLNTTLSSAQTQFGTGFDRAFSQWRNEPLPLEGGTSYSSAPVRETSPFFQTVRLILTRFETLDGRGYEARFQLYPEQLGTVHVKIVLHQGVMQAQLIVDTRTAKEALEAQLQSLQQAFAQQGLQVEKIQVTVREDPLFQWHEQNAFLYQEQRQQGNGAQGGYASGSTGRLIGEELEEEQEETRTDTSVESTSMKNIDLSI